MTEKLSEEQVREQGLADWQVVDHSLRTRLRTGDFATGLRLVNLIGQAAEAANHHPDLDLRYPHLDVTLTTHDVGGLSERDVQMARQISDLASREGVVAAPDEAR
ncbi:MAG TPA: 4a-hydroxytetrahydrobiopterin dehydratase [Beutenbergiaceae bacterium]|nr:4a-hydroxytetrahydrobiopterin dehydratase [Beutenbergiaceae bacterium]